MQGFWWAFNRSLQVSGVRDPEQSDWTYEGPLAPLVLIALSMLVGLYVHSSSTGLLIAWFVYCSYLAFAAARLATRIRIPRDALGLAPLTPQFLRLAGLLLAALLPLLVEIAWVVPPAALIARYLGFDLATTTEALVVLVLQPFWYGAWGAAFTVACSPSATPKQTIQSVVVMARVTTFYLPVLATLGTTLFAPTTILFCFTNQIWVQMLLLSPDAPYHEIALSSTFVAMPIVQSLIALSLLGFAARNLPQDTF